MVSPNSSDSLEVRVEMVNGVAVLKPMGDIDLSRSPDLRLKLAEVQRPNPDMRLIVDLEKVPYMDSSGVATLVEAMQIARRNGGRIVLCNLNDRVRSIIEIARLDKVFKIVGSVDDALEE